MDVFNVSCLFS